MTVFWLSTIGLVVLAVFLLWYIISDSKTNHDDALRDELNKALYQDRLEELSEEANEGLVDNQQDLEQDLKQSLLDDIPEQTQRQQTRISSKAVLMLSTVLIVVLSYGMYWYFGGLNKVQHWQEVSSNLPELSKKLMPGSNEPLTDDEMQDLTLALRTQLHYKPNDSTGWMLLGRIAIANRNVTTAIDAMEKAYRLKSDDGDIKLGYAQALMMSQEEMDQNQARSLLTSLMQEEYVDIRVFSLLAFDAFESEDYPSAIKYWSVMQRMVGPEDARFEMLGKSIANAQERMKGSVVPGQAVAVTISLSADVVADNNASLIVSVHTADGSPMPIAAARYPLGSFPRTVVLDDNNSMIEARKLSSLTDIMVRVRLDSDGNVTTKQGDWYGESQPAKLGDTVDVLVDKQY
ncbi:c-type cytochrome biogenesis protein CcmI [Vibrio hippocampi]|uniref:C-type cytochrome biogenesis protein CcmI n=1 Tax=Vibrio hippocampi TaxID=654686 RepID=A0ABM8ZFU5_9VIBR|nr:c-type cytochrome biogenesis protein CcmI [Vibrio hippocampi]CAH0525240.1 hypothetical protein VHP8226_00871 [Vibrio hippocampi]